MARKERITNSLALEALDALEKAGCQYWNCKGPDVRPEPMVTCMVCRTIRNLRAALKRNGVI